MNDESSPPLLKKFLICLFAPPWRTWRTNVATLATIILPGPFMSLMIALLGLIYITPPPPSFKELPHFRGTLLAESDLSDGINYFLGPDGKILLQCSWFQRRYYGSSCLPDEAIGMSDLNVTYWPKYNLLMQVSSGTGKMYRSYDDEVRLIEQENEFNSPAHRFMFGLVSDRPSKWRKYYAISAMAIINIVSLFGLILWRMDSYKLNMLVLRFRREMKDRVLWYSLYANALYHTCY